MGSERRAVAAMVLATLLWGGTFVVIRDSLASLTPAPLVCARFIAAAVIFALALTLRRRAPDRVAITGGLASGALAAGAYLLQAIGLITTSAGSSAFLTCAGTMFAALFAWPLLHQRPSRRLALGLLLALGGVALLTLRGDFHVGRGETWTLLGALLYALQIVVLARVAPRTDAVAIGAVQSLTIALVLLPFAGPGPAEFAALAVAGWSRFAYLALAGSVVAPWLQVVAQGALPAGRIGLLFALEPVFALLFAITAGHERFIARWWLGAVLILIGVVWVEVRASSSPAAVRRARS